MSPAAPEQVASQRLSNPFAALLTSQLFSLVFVFVLSTSSPSRPALIVRERERERESSYEDPVYTRSPEYESQSDSPRLVLFFRFLLQFLSGYVNVLFSCVSRDTGTGRASVR